MRYHTFLKGWWLLSDEGIMVWTMLPSSVIKMGKSCNNPKIIMKHNKKEKLSWKTAYARLAYCFSKSYGIAPNNVPIVSPMLEKFAKMSEETTSEYKRKYDNIKFTKKYNINRQEALRNYNKRYGSITEQDCYEIELLINSVYQFPAILHHPVFAKLVLRDYY
jgi:hypothetical protein